MDNKLTKEDFIKQYKERTEKSKKEIINDILKDVNPKDYLKVKDNIVQNSNLCIILSCPGEEEMLKQKVCAGETGNNLEKILRIVVNEIKEIKPRIDEKCDKIRYNYNIINSVDDVHFYEYSNDSEANEDDVKNDANIKRVNNELEKIEIKYYLVCGNNAEVLFDKIVKRNDENVAYVSHLGNRAIRNKYRNSHKELMNITDTAKRDEKRIELIAKEIIELFNKNN